MKNYTNEEIVYITSQTQLNLRQVIFVTKQGMTKIVDGGEFDVSKRTVAATKLNDADTVVSVMSLLEQRNIILQTKDGFFLRFSIEEIPEKKKAAVGVRAIKLNPKDEVEKVYYTRNLIESIIQYKDKPVVLNNIKPGKRDTKGTKIRV